MLAANVCSADFIEHSGRVGLFRVHDKPSLEKQDILRNYLKAMGVGMALGENPATSEFQAIANATKDRPDAQQIHTMLLRSMMQAFYTPENSGHFGLAFDAYTHFTSPIRRYPDLLVHRVIKAELEGTHYRLPELPTPGGRSQVGCVWPRVSVHPARSRASARPPPRSRPGRLQACTAARTSAAPMRPAEMSRPGSSASTCVSIWGGVRRRGLCGHHLRHLRHARCHVCGGSGPHHRAGDYFRFDEARQELRGERSGIRYGIGTRLRVQVSRVDLDGRRIDFRLVRDGEEQPASGRSGRAPARTEAHHGENGGAATPEKRAQRNSGGAGGARSESDGAVSSGKQGRKASKKAMVKGVNLAALEAEYASAQSRPAAPVRQSDVSEPAVVPGSSVPAARASRKGRAAEARKSVAIDADHGLPQLPPPSPVQALRALGKKALGPSSPRWQARHPSPGASPEGVYWPSRWASALALNGICAGHWSAAWPWRQAASVAACAGPALAPIARQSARREHLRFLRWTAGRCLWVDPAGRRCIAVALRSGDHGARALQQRRAVELERQLPGC